MAARMMSWQLRYSMNVVLLLALCCLCHVVTANATQERIYHHRLDNGEVLICSKCQPGYHFIAHCTRDTPKALCQQCPNGTYSPFYNLATKCQSCSTHCIRNTPGHMREYIAVTCTSTADIVCRCKEEYFRESQDHGVCRRKSECPKGQGVLKKADAFNNTTCIVCPSGTYSNISSLTETCANCSKCQPGEVLAFQCNRTTDTVCKTKSAGSVGGNGLELWKLVVIISALALLVIIVVIIFVLHRRGIIRFPCDHDVESEDIKENGKCANEKAVEFQNLLTNGKANTIEAAPPVHQNGNGVHSGPDAQVRGVYRDLSERFVQNYKMLFRGLNLDDNDIRRVELDNDKFGTKEKIYQLFLSYHGKKSRTRDELVVDLTSAFEGYCQGDVELYDSCVIVINTLQSTSTES